MVSKFGEAANAQINLTASTTADLRRRIESLEQMNNVSLRAVWKQARGQAAPKGARKRFLMLGIAWRWQSKLLGGWSPELARRLSALETCSSAPVTDGVIKTGDIQKAARPTPGTRLVREWQGERLEVHVTEQGYLWRGRTYGSLSSVAKAITGINRNGPKFFGFRDKRRVG